MRQKPIIGKIKEVDELEIQRTFGQSSLTMQKIKGSVQSTLDINQNSIGTSVASFWGIISSCPEEDASMLMILKKYLSEQIITDIFNNNEENSFYKKFKLIFLEIIKRGKIAMRFFHNREIFPIFLGTNLTSEDKKDIILAIVNYKSDFPIASFLIGGRNNFGLLINSNLEENHILEILEKSGTLISFV